MVTLKIFFSFFLATCVLLTQLPYFGAAWGTTTGSLVSWELLDFGLKRSKANLAKTDVEKAESEAELTELEIAQRAFESSSTHLKSLQDTKFYLHLLCQLVILFI